MIRGEVEVSTIKNKLNKTEQVLNLYEDIKYVELCKTQRTMIICFALIIMAMIMGFFIWMSTPDEREISYEQIADANNNSSVSQTIGE